MSAPKPNLDSLFLSASKIESEIERAAFLTDICGDDLDLRHQIEQLLESHQQAGSSLEKPTPDLDDTFNLDGDEGASADSIGTLNAGMASAFGDESAVVMGDADHSVLKSLERTTKNVPRVSLRDEVGDDPISNPLSKKIRQSDSDGRYQLQGEIARGGMGAVLKGRDTDLGRDLAIKVLLDSNKDNPQVIQRFIEEAQIGGQLQHPGIAPVYELGQFADERPFFSMKLVKGETLSKLLRDRKNTTDERAKFIGIFEQICQTMAYAHSRGVLHRDLKPANIMVGAFGEVQVMDWGLAKVLQSDGLADEKTAKQTQQGQSIIQTMRSVGSNVSGSFGSTGSETQMGSVMGTPAYMPPEQALGEIDQLDQRADVFGLGAILCEILTSKPAYVGKDGTQTYRMASRGKLDDAFLRLDRCGADAELIAMAKHCLELEPANRPKDANVLAKRITAYLESVEQKLRETELAKVDAQVRSEEMRRRQRLAYTAGTAIMATLLIGISASLWQMFRANDAQQLARNEATRATAAERLAKEAAVRAKTAERLAKEEAARATTAEQKTASTLVQVAAERDAKELARKEAEQVSNFLGNILQSPDPARDGRKIKIAELLDQTAERLETDLTDQPELRAKFQWTLGNTYDNLGLHKQATPLLEMARDWAVTHLDNEDSKTLGATFDLAENYGNAGRRDEAMEMFEDLLTTRIRVLGPKHPDTLDTMSYLAGLYLSAGRLNTCQKMWEKVLNARRESLGPEHPLTLAAIHNMAMFYDNVGRQKEALGLQEQALTLRLKVSGKEHPDTLKAITGLAITYDKLGRQDEALELFEKALPLQRKVLGDEHSETLKVMNNLARAYLYANRRAESLKLQEDALSLSRKVLSPEHPQTLMTMSNLAYTYHQADRNAEALKMQEELLKLIQNANGMEHPDSIMMMANLALFYDTAGRVEDALKIREKVLAFNNKVLGPKHPNTVRVRQNLALSYDAVGRKDEAATIREEALDVYREMLGQDHAKTLNAMNDLAFSLDATDRRDEAAQLREAVLTLCRKKLGLQHPETLSAMNNLAFSLESVHRRDEAAQLREEILSLSPDDPNAHNETAWRFVVKPDRQGQPEAKKVVTWARRAHELSPNNADFSNTLGVALYRAKEWQGAIDELQKSIKLGADEPLNWLFIAMAHWQRDQKDDAKLWYDKSLAWQTTNADAVRSDTELQGFFAEAAHLMTELLEASLDDQSTDVAGLSQRAAAYLAKEKHDLAKADWLRVIKLQPQQLQHAFATFHNAEQWNIAAEFGQQLIDQKPEDKSLWIQVAPVVVRSGDQGRYSKFCQLILKTSLGTYESAEKAIKVCLLQESNIDISDLPSETLISALDQQTATAEFRSRGWATRALLAYRSGDAALAVKYVAKSEDNQPVDFTRAMNLAILAMAHHNLDQPDQQNSALEKASKLITSLNKDPSKRDAHDLRIAEILFREAEGRIKK